MDLLQYTFFQHALIGSLLASIVCGLIGTYIVTRRLVFISGGLTHASFGGIGLGLYTGISPILAAGVFAVLSAFGVEWLSKRNDMREDSAIAVFWTLGMALGIMFTFLSPGFAPDLSAYLFGNILTITFGDIALLAGLAVILAIFFILYLRPIIYVAFDREFARSQGIPVQIFEYVLMVFIALTIVAGTLKIKFSGFSWEYAYMHYWIVPKNAPYYQVRLSERICLPRSTSTPFNELFRQFAALSRLRLHVTL